MYGRTFCPALSDTDWMAFLLFVPFPPGLGGLVAAAVMLPRPFDE